MSDSSPFSRLVIRASAGSGKTYRLSARYLRLLLEGAPIDSTEMAQIENATSHLSANEKYEYLKNRHLEDYCNLFGRVNLELDFDKEDLSLTTDKLLYKYKKQDKKDSSCPSRSPTSPAPACTRT